MLEIKTKKQSVVVEKDQEEPTFGRVFRAGVSDEVTQQLKPE